ncbi:Transcriptional regulatory protein LiaR [Actinomadura sp. RB68]|uniref:Transcriptional regulatory protein LiaR n=1 Tax=Actinomadura macrotermitis TaxID=2585200 RepID=A0A7K0C3R8_9ACTN|nr:Transcriptional regulatory protein LiaR [Actinomadura macrotermitis]
MTRVLLVDDDALVRSALAMMLDGAEGIAVVAEACDGAEVPDAVAAHFPDVVLMDLRMPRVGGIEATRRLRRLPRPPEVIVLTTFDTDDNVVAALRAGAGGFLLKDSPPARIVAAIHRVAAGEPMLSPQITRRLMESVTTRADAYRRAVDALAALTPREHEVALAVARGEGNAEIAGTLGMSVPTVKSHVSRILAKLALNNRTQLALLAHDADLI